MSYRNVFTALVACMMSLTQVVAQTRNNVYQTYIDTYKVVAILQMQKYQIPASITLAQGLLESAAGQSRLAQQANNHFGIKVGGDWTGPYILSDDETKDERFRKYNNVSESFEDHSLFLHKQRYAPLFQLSPTDYKAWAQTLKSCGYATDPRYADNLINIIERYDLAQYDNAIVTTDQASQYIGATNRRGSSSSAQGSVTPGRRGHSSSSKGSVSSGQDFYAQHKMGLCNGNYYIIVQRGDDIESIAKAVGKKARKLRKYNDIPKGCGVYTGQIIYLGSKKAKASEKMRGVPHIVRAGESIYTISQLYGVKMSSIYEINSLASDYAPRVGDKLYVY